MSLDRNGCKNCNLTEAFNCEAVIQVFSFILSSIQTEAFIFTPSLVSVKHAIRTYYFIFILRATFHASHDTFCC